MRIPKPRLKKPKIDAEKARENLRRAFLLFIVITFVITGLGIGVAGFIQATRQKDEPTNQNEPAKLKGTQMPEFTPVADVAELKITDKVVGDGKEAGENANVVVQYIGAFADNGIIFDTSLDSGQPAPFNLNDVIPGFRQGIIGMKVGGSREILIPSELGYGPDGKPPTIPPNADLVFSVSLIDVQ